MISEEIIIYIIALGFGLLGLIHFIYPKILMKYSIEADLLNADIAVKMSGALLIAASIMLFTEKYWEYFLWSNWFSGHFQPDFT